MADFEDRAEAPTTYAVTDEDLLKVWMGGLASGVATSVTNWMMLPHEEARRRAAHACLMVQSDPVLYEQTKATAVSIALGTPNPDQYLTTAERTQWREEVRRRGLDPDDLEPPH